MVQFVCHGKNICDQSTGNYHLYPGLRRRPAFQCAPGKATSSAPGSGARGAVKFRFPEIFNFPAPDFLAPAPKPCLYLHTEKFM